VREQIDVARASITQLTGQLDEVRGELQEQRGRFASLQGAAAGCPGADDEVVTGWLQAQGLARNQRVAERLTVEPGWETAVETVLAAICRRCAWTT